uniref:Uncharacterized protein n=2 Tax=Meloidogyne TaxID=189290 RepID=A0A6V7X4A2_MELEN|nr:unnamed protein product [Meloidogyne enterolobii]
MFYSNDKLFLFYLLFPEYSLKVATNVSENQKEICGELEIHKQHHINPNNSVLLRIEEDQKVDDLNKCIERCCNLTNCSAITFTGFLTSNLNSTNTQKCLLFFCTNNNSSSNIGGRCHFTKGTNEEINFGLLSVEMLRETFNNETNLLNESEKINGEDLQLNGEIEEITTQIKYKETTNHSFIDLSTWDEIFPLDPQHVPVWIIGLAIVILVVGFGILLGLFCSFIFYKSYRSRMRSAEFSRKKVQMLHAFNPPTIK